MLDATSARSAQRYDRGTKAGRSLWRALHVALVAAVVGIAAFLLYRNLRGYDFADVVHSVSSLPLASLIAALAFGTASYLCLTGFDYLALRFAGRPQPYRKVAPVSFVSLSIGHNIGFAALSSGAIRYRFYSRLGLGPEEVGKVILFCAVTVGLGLIVLGGIALLIRPDAAGALLGLSRTSVLLVAAASIGAAPVYLALAGFLRRPLIVRGLSINMPSIRLAVAQLLIGPLNFACVAACLYSVIAAATEVSYPNVAAVYVIGNIAGLISHVPGGLGVLEGVVLHLVPGADLIGALLAFRFVYFLLPLAVGGPLFALMETRLRRTDSVPPRE